MMQYLPWWTGAVALSTIVIGFWLSIGRPLGVSGSWARIVMWREDKKIERAEAPFRANPRMLQDALMKATIEHFGEADVFARLARHGGKPMSSPSDGGVGLQARATWTMHAVFLVMLILGGVLATLAGGGYQPRFDLDELHSQLFGTGMGYIMTLFVGGALVGFGTQLGGGCTSGHGLSGCSRLVPASLIATAAFFGTAVIVSLLLHLYGGGLK